MLRSTEICTVLYNFSYVATQLEFLLKLTTWCVLVVLYILYHKKWPKWRGLPIRPLGNPHLMLLAVSVLIFNTHAWPQTWPIIFGNEMLWHLKPFYINARGPKYLSPHHCLPFLTLSAAPSLNYGSALIERATKPSKEQRILFPLKWWSK